MTQEETERTIKEKACYAQIWAKCNSNCLVASGMRTSLNKELERKSRTLSEEARDSLIERKLTYQVNQWRDTEYQMDRDKFSERWEWLKKHGFRIQLTHSKDIKFRHKPNKWLQFYTYVGLIEEIFQQYPDLKLHIYGPGFENFKFSDMFLESESNLNQYHMRQISRCERSNNIQFDSFWSTVDNASDYALGVGIYDKLPLADVQQT